MQVGLRLKERKEEIARIMTREMGKVLVETRGDVQEGIDTAYFIAGEGRRLFGDTTPTRAAQQVRDVGPPADRGLRIDHAVELPDGDSHLEDVPGAALRQHRRLQAGVRHAGLAPELVEVLEESGRPTRRREHRPRRRPGGGRRRSSSHPGVRLISFTGSSEVGQAIGGVCGADAQALLARARRQERARS